MDAARISILIKKTALVFDKISNQLLRSYDLTGSQFKIVSRTGRRCDYLPGQLPWRDQ